VLCLGEAVRIGNWFWYGDGEGYLGFHGEMSLVMP
jgi:hypothetical protein